jgi:hypothetical protein
MPTILLLTPPPLSNFQTLFRNAGARGATVVHWHIQFLADQLTLFQPELWHILPTTLLLAPQICFTYRHPCYPKYKKSIN